MQASIENGYGLLRFCKSGKLPRMVPHVMVLPPSSPLEGAPPGRHCPEGRHALIDGVHTKAPHYGQPGVGLCA